MAMQHILENIGLILSHVLHYVSSVLQSFHVYAPRHRPRTHTHAHTHTHTHVICEVAHTHSHLHNLHAYEHKRTRTHKPTHSQEFFSSVHSNTIAWGAVPCVVCVRVLQLALR